ncbi:EAL domain-containing protein [Alteraurantiacibacter aquimixticola]|uniref:EAL domain-containing protein n=1 Tax=Alteraurantiacibacter aquimixticola TaxID=2489173 RepID=A0A4T3F1J8_9SPHN|nr:EAL domain-containing protein [Alteraurantiacibacter aquimixticola]TIX51036.1 EAL domain-containing protein [Alteraurantiacibacter aquimixticola]
MSATKERISAMERIRHASWAGLIALVLTFLTIIEPIDQMTWVTQSRLASFPASGDIVYVGSAEDLTDPDSPERRERLATTLDRLRASGTERVYLDMVFDRPSTPDADSALNTALRAYDGQAYLVQSITTGLNGVDEMERSFPTVGERVEVVGSKRWRNFLGYTWTSPYVVSFRDQALPSLPASIAGQSAKPGEEFRINYGFDLASIPTHRYQDLQPVSGPLGTVQQPDADVDGKVVVIGNLKRADTNASNIPGHIEVPASMVDIYAAETLKAGLTDTIGSYTVLLTVLFALYLLSQSNRRMLRRACYAGIAIGLCVAVYVTALMGVKIEIAGALFLLLIYAAMRVRANWRTSYRLEDPDTGLPTFAALENSKDVAETVPAIIVAKIHRFEEVRKTLPSDLHSEYMLRIIGRLRAAKEDARIFLGPGHLIAWTLPEKEPAIIREHLEGLRALFSSPLLVDDNQVDVGITFGVDITPSPNVVRRLAGAVEAAEGTTETYEPIEIAELASDEDLIWNISLQARIDAALSNGEIYLIYQPKILVATGEMVGVEALVRWRDPIKGLIPPDHFIRQCENAGRMSQLTRHVLRDACQAGIAFEEEGLPLSVAVNVSATLVHERDIVNMVREVLQDTGFDPHRLTLEITETYRISNYERAAEILNDLAALGPKISMDDFGVGAASLEALQRLPFTELKIDRAFTSAIKDNPKSAAIVRNVLNLGKDLRVIVVAEGVEDEATLTILRDSGCLVAQGFAISRPIPFKEILVFQSVDKKQSLTNMV